MKLTPQRVKSLHSIVGVNYSLDFFKIAHLFICIMLYRCFIYHLHSSINTKQTSIFNHHEQLKFEFEFEFQYHSKLFTRVPTNSLWMPCSACEFQG